MSWKGVRRRCHLPIPKAQVSDSRESGYLTKNSREMFKVEFEYFARVSDSPSLSRRSSQCKFPSFKTDG